MVPVLSSPGSGSGGFAHNVFSMAVKNIFNDDVDPSLATKFDFFHFVSIC